MDGETFDARLDHPGWDRAGFNDRGWSRSHEAQVNPMIKLVAESEPPIKSNLIVPAIAVAQPEPGAYVYKLPQDITGVARVRIKGEKGSRIQIRYAELLKPDGTLNFITLESPGIPGAHAKATDEYVFEKSGYAVFQPEFTFHGFQYIEIKGAVAGPALTDVMGIVYGTDVPATGQFATSSSYLNRLQSALRWSGRDANMSAPMDWSPAHGKAWLDR